MAGIGIDENDKQFLTELGTGTNVTTNCDEWWKATRTHAGKTVRKVKDDHSNVVPRIRGKETSEKKRDATKDKNVSLSANLQAGAPNVPAGGSVKAGGSRLRTLNSVQYEKVAVIRTLAFKDDTPSFPTELEKDMYKYVIEQLKRDQSASHSSSATIEADVHVEGDDIVYVKKFNEYTSHLEDGKWDVISDTISNYIVTKKITHYVSSIALGTKETEIKRSEQERTEFDAGAEVKATRIAGGGMEGGFRSELGNNTLEKKGFGDDRVCADEGEENLAIVRVGITPISELVEDPRVKAILDNVTNEYQEQKKRRMELKNGGLIGPVQIRCDDGLDKVYWCVDDGARIIKGTSDEEKSSKFYLDDKGKGVIYIFYFKGSEIGANKRRLAVRKGAELPCAQITTAKVPDDYDNKRYNLEFEMKKRDPDPGDKGKMTVTDWLNKKDSVYLRVRSEPFMIFWSKSFYIKMNAVQGSEYDISFISEDNSSINLSDDTFLFLCESTTAASFVNCGELLGGGNASSSSSRKVVDESTATSYIPDSAPPSESRTQSDSSSAEISDNPYHFSTLVSEDYIFPDLDMFEEEN